MAELFETIFFCIVGASLLFLLVRFCVIEYRLHKIGKAPVYTEPATVHYKHPEQDLINAGRANGSIFYITFHTDFGVAVKCYMGYEHFYILEEGMHGELTWQGERFIKFIPETKER